MTSRCQGLFPPHPFFKGKALGTRLAANRCGKSGKLEAVGKTNQEKNEKTNKQTNSAGTRTRDCLFGRMLPLTSRDFIRKHHERQTKEVNDRLSQATRLSKQASK